MTSQKTEADEGDAQPEISEHTKVESNKPVDETKETKEENDLPASATLIHVNAEILNSECMVNHKVAITGRYVNSPAKKCYTFKCTVGRNKTFLVHAPRGGYIKHSMYQIIGHVCRDFTITQESYKQLDDQKQAKEEKQKYGTIAHVTAELLHSGRFRNKKVAIVGRYIKKELWPLYVFAARGEKRFMVCNESYIFQGYKKDTVYHIVGHVGYDNTIYPDSYQDWGDKFDTKGWNKFVTLSKDFPNLF